MRFCFDFLPRPAAMIAALLLALTVAGCLPSTKEGPERLFPVAEETAAIRSAVQAPDLFSQSSGYRNSYVLARMYAIDLQYYPYEASLTHERQDVSFAADVVNIGLTSSVPLVSAKATKDALGAAASALTGIKNAYDDDILLNRTIQILQSQMRANRADVAARIIAKLRQPITAYPMALALSDLEDYYRAGTISGALLSVSSTVSAEAAIAQDERAAAVIGTVITNPAAPIVPVPRGEPAHTPGDTLLSPVEKMLRTAQIKNIQKLVCAGVDGKLGPHGSETRTKIFVFLKKKEPAKSFSSDILTLDDRDTLLDAIDAGEPSNC